MIHKFESSLKNHVLRFQSFLQAYNSKENPPLLLPHDLVVDEEHELLLQSPLSSAHCNTLEHDGEGDDKDTGRGVDVGPAIDMLFLINLFSGPTIFRPHSTITNLKNKHTMTSGSTAKTVVIVTIVVVDPIEHIPKEFNF
uniref:Uncharacterized protein n=1 Tax=Populus alba TaxID=43335 RepID=A0A4U5Q9Q3_POPAL|nr:hypothetical protein D5086_0000120820 [Populus alba]